MHSTGRATRTSGSSVSKLLTVIDFYRQFIILREFAGVLVYVVLLVSACGGIIEESSGHSIFRDDFSTMPGELKLKIRLHVARRFKSAL